LCFVRGSSHIIETYLIGKKGGLFKMKKIIIAMLVLIVLALSGCGGGITGGAVICNKPYLLVGDDCCLDKDDNTVCDKDEIPVTPAEEVEPPKEAVVEEVVEELVEVEAEPVVEEVEEEETLGEFLVKKGDVITFEGKKITVIDVNNIPQLKVTLSVDDIEREIYGTKNPEIISGLKIQILRYEQLKTAALIEVKNLDLGEDEYLFGTRNALDLFGKEITLRDVLNDGAIMFDVVDGNIVDFKLHLDEGESLEVQGITITNLEGYPSGGIRINKLAIVKITE